MTKKRPKWFEIDQNWTKNQAFLIYIVEKHPEIVSFFKKQTKEQNEKG